MNVTAQKGLTAEFSTTPTDVVLTSTRGNMYLVTVTANPTLAAGTYQVRGEAALGSHLFDWSLTFAVG